MSFSKVYITIITSCILLGCSNNNEKLASYHNQLANTHNDLKITYEELVDDFGWVITTDTSIESRREFVRTYKTKFRDLKREVSNIATIEEDTESELRQKVLKLTNFIIVYTDSLSIAAYQLVNGMDPTLDFEKFDTEVVNRFHEIEKSRDEFLKATGLLD